jgi:anti-anti-sigma factor
MEEKMTVTKQAGEKLVLEVEGRIDTTTAPQLQAELIPAFDENKDVVLDFAKVNYISSAGLRILLMGQKTAAAKGGTLVLKNLIDDVSEVLNMTGFSKFMTIE